MANIAITEFCNRACPYCFAREKMRSASSSEGGSMKFDDYVFAVDFLVRSGNRQINLIGGEPTLHGQFREMISYNNDNGLKTMVFTNGVVSRQLVDHLEKFDTINYLVNLNELEEYRRDELEAIYYFFSRLSKHTRIGFNFYKPGQSISFIEDLISKYGLKRNIRIGIAVKIAGERRAEDERVFQKEVLEYLAGRAKELYAKRISLSADCGSLPPCICEEKHLGELLKYADYAPRFKCDEAIDIGCGLKVWKCFATSSLFNRNLREFNNLEEIQSYFKSSFTPFKLLGSSPECEKCGYREMDRCEGGCQAEVYNTYRDFKQRFKGDQQCHIKIRLSEDISEVMNLKSGKALVFRGNYHDIFRMIDDGVPRAAIIERISEKYMMPHDSARKFVDDLHGILKEYGILEKNAP